MTLAQKVRQLRQLEGELRGLGRELTQAELVRAIRSELDETISQSYLSLIEKGSRKHLSNESRQLLAKFFKVHPGYLVSDPPGFRPNWPRKWRPPKRSWIAGSSTARRVLPAMPCWPPPWSGLPRMPTPVAAWCCSAK